MAGNDLNVEEAAAFKASHAHWTKTWSGDTPTPAEPLMEDGKCRCLGSISGGSGSFSTYQCERRASVTLSDGSTWCGVHSPLGIENRNAAVARRAEKDRARWRAESAMRDRAAKERAGVPALVAALEAIANGANDSREIARVALAAHKGAA